MAWEASRVLTSVEGWADMSPAPGGSAEVRVLRQMMQRLSMTEMRLGRAKMKGHDDDAVTGLNRAGKARHVSVKHLPKDFYINLNPN